MLPKTGNKLPHGPHGPEGDSEFRKALAAALKRELGATHQATKTVMRWTGASEKTAKHWLAGTHVPSGYHLVCLARNSDAALMCFLLAANRPYLSAGARWSSIRSMILELVEAIDASGNI